jgi:pimeloyl-ACP methyl ester carboxylesterase
MGNRLRAEAKLIVGVLALSFLIAALWGAPPPGQPAEEGRKALDLLLAARYSDFGELLTAEAKDKLTPDVLRDRVGAEIKSFGTLQDVGEPRTMKSGDTDIVSFPVRFSNNRVNIQLNLNEAGEITALSFRSPNDPLPQVWTRPIYSKPDLFQERDVTVGTDQWKLDGKFTFPTGKGPFPVVVLVHGPGPNDLDESIYATRIFADIAEGLASRGIAVLRYDKRTSVYGQEMSKIPFTLREETIEDAVRAIAIARRQPEVDPRRVFVLGHSLGGYANPRIARQDGKVAGAIMLAANARPIEDISLAQTEFMLKAKGGASPDEQKRLDLLKAQVAKVKSLASDKDNPPTLMGLPTAYFLDLKGYDPPGEARRLAIPMLFLQGERDFQVTMEDFGLWKTGLAGTKDITFHSYPALNDLFIAGDGPPSPLEYRKAANVAPDVIEDIAAWVAVRKLGPL